MRKHKADPMRFVFSDRIPSKFPKGLGKFAIIGVLGICL